MVLQPCPDLLAWVRMHIPQLVCLVPVDGSQLPLFLEEWFWLMGAFSPMKWRPSGWPTARD